ncbi:MAG: TMEM175 family protein [Woeseiaceae bacterium]|nr:TMEM175 family protein [Woeseiaceae bacterium]
MNDKTLAHLPVREGFRQRGEEMTRLETFTDAAFAFAVTLLVVGGGDSVPDSYSDMVAAMKQVPAFAASFANIMFFWYAHHVWSRRFGLENAGAMFLSLLLVFVVLIYVYPLKAIYSGAIEFFTAGYLPSFFSIGSLDDLRTMFVIFGVGYFSLSAVIVLLNRHALKCRDRLQLSELEVFDTQTTVRVWIINMIVPAGSIVLALTLPGPLLFLAGMFYASFGVLMPLNGVRRARQRAEFFGTPAPGATG